MAVSIGNEISGNTMGLGKLSILLFVCGFSRCDDELNKPLMLPDDFMFGAASAAYQVEGAYKADGKGLNQWDVYTHAHPEAIQDHCTGDISADFYHHYPEDIRRVKLLGLNTFRFSISWTRIMANGQMNTFNKRGIDHYNKVVDKCLEYNITPIVNIEYWDLPQKLIDLGGWTNPHITPYFVDFADLLFKAFGDRVKFWLTFNEPKMMTHGYDGNATGRAYPPNVASSGIAPYLMGHNILKAHATVYHLYDKKYRPTQKGKISIILEATWFEPKDPNNPSDVEASDRAMHFGLGWFAHPIFSKDGDYSEIMKRRIAIQSKKEGFRRSRLLSFTEDEVNYIKGTADYFSFNMYTTSLVTCGEHGPIPSVERDSGVVASSSPDWPSAKRSPWLKIVPKGMRKILNWIKDKYGDWPIMITENGLIDGPEINDKLRCNYFGSYILQVLKAIYYDKVNVIGYLAWSLLDSFEWNSGYTSVAGLFQVDMNDPERKRTPKDSSKLISEIARTRTIPPEYVEYNDNLERRQFPSNKRR